VSHPNIYTFLTHLQNATVDCMTDSERLCRGVEIRRPKKQRNILNDARIKSFIEHYDNVANSRLQFRQAISHSLHTPKHFKQLRKLTVTTKMTPVSDQSAVVESTHQPLLLPLQLSTQLPCLLRVMSAPLHPEMAWLWCLVGTHVSAWRVQTYCWSHGQWLSISADRRFPAFCVCLHNISHIDILARTVSAFYARHVMKHANIFTLHDIIITICPPFSAVCVCVNKLEYVRAF